MNPVSGEYRRRDRGGIDVQALLIIVVLVVLIIYIVNRI